MNPLYLYEIVYPTHIFDIFHYHLIASRFSESVFVICSYKIHTIQNNQKIMKIVKIIKNGC